MAGSIVTSRLRFERTALTATPTRSRRLLKYSHVRTAGRFPIGSRRPRATDSSRTRSRRSPSPRRSPAPGRRRGRIRNRPRPMPIRRLPLTSLLPRRHLLEIGAHFREASLRLVSRVRRAPHVPRGPLPAAVVGRSSTVMSSDERWATVKRRCSVRDRLPRHDLRCDDVACIESEFISIHPRVNLYTRTGSYW